MIFFFFQCTIDYGTKKRVAECPALWGCLEVNDSVTAAPVTLICKIDMLFPQSAFINGLCRASIFYAVGKSTRMLKMTGHDRYPVPFEVEENCGINELFIKMLRKIKYQFLIKTT